MKTNILILLSLLLLTKESRSKDTKFSELSETPQQSRRRASHMGLWYPDHQNVHKSSLMSALSKAEKSINNSKTPNPQQILKVLIVPHAAYPYSLPTAAYAYININTTYPYTRILLLGPSHNIPDRGILLTPVEYIQTPFGDLEVDLQFMRKLGKIDGFRYITKEQDEEEHSLEMQFPIIKYLWDVGHGAPNKYTHQKPKTSIHPIPKIIPLLVGNIDDKKREQYFGGILSALSKDQTTLIIVSSDFCHFGYRFNYQVYDKSEEAWETIMKRDAHAMELISAHDAKGFRAFLDETGDTICGKYPILLMLQMLNSANKYDFETKFVKYDMSNKPKNAGGSSVSYAAAYTLQQPKTNL